MMKNEQDQTDDQFLLEQFSDQTSRNFLQAPLDQVKHLYEQTLSNSSPISKSFLLDQYPKDFRRRRTDLTPVIKSYQAFDDNIYRIF
jgi:hypothetical protein